MWYYIVCFTQLVSRQMIDLYICTLKEFIYSIQYPTVVILGNTHTRRHTMKLIESMIFKKIWRGRQPNLIARMPAFVRRAINTKL